MVALLLLLLFLLLPSSLCALPPVFVLGGGGGVSWEKVGEESARSTPYGEVSGTLGYRGFLGEAGYFGVTGYAGLLYYRGDLNEFGDEQFFSLEFGLPLGDVTLRGESSLDSSLTGSGAERYALPEWEFTISPTVEAAEISPRATYFGSYYNEARVASDRVVHGVRVGVEGEPEVTLGWYGDLLGAWERFPEQRVASDGGVRDDGRFGAALGADGLLGYFNSWEAKGQIGLRLSNAEAGREDRLYSQVGGSLHLSPTQAVALQLDVGIDHDYYLEQNVVTAGGEVTDSTLQQLSLSGGLRLDYTPNGAIFFVLQGGGSRSYSEDPAYSGWSSYLSGKIEYSF